MASVAHSAEHGGPSNFIGEIHRCAVDPSRWASILRRTSKLVNGCAAAIIAYTPGEDVLHFGARWNISKEFERAIVASAPLSPAVPAIWLLGIEQPIIASTFYRAGDFDTLWHRTTLQPQGLRDFAIIPLTRSIRSFSMLTIMRTADSGSYRANEGRTLATLTPHFQESAAISQLLNITPSDGPAASDRSATGVIFTNDEGRILGTNRAGASLLDGCALLCLEGALSARDGESAAALRVAIAAAGHMHSAFNRRITSLVIKGAGSSEITVWVMPVGKRSGSSTSDIAHSSVAVIVSAREMAKRVAPWDDEETGRGKRYAPAVEDDRILAMLTKGFTLDEAVGVLSMPEAAARASVTRLMRKARAQEDSDLLRLVEGASLQSA